MTGALLKEVRSAGGDEREEHLQTNGVTSGANKSAVEESLD